MTDVMQTTGSLSGPQIAVLRDKPETPRQGRGSRLGRKTGPLIFSLSVAGSLYLAWRVSGQQHLTAESGLGYALGIVGGVMMLLLLLYPLRKKLRFMRAWGGVRYWFRIHMILGVLGPSLILVHANFKLGSLNSNVALIAMLFVVASGLVGRFIYTKIHLGLYGKQANLDDLRGDTQALKLRAGMDMPELPEVVERLRAFEAEALSKDAGILRDVRRLATLGARSRWLRLSLRHDINAALGQVGRQQKWSARTLRSRKRAARKYVAAYTRSVRRVAEFVVYERLFGLWHILHLPLFVVLVLAALAHVVAVHLY
jgi:hypothetical protein